MVSYEELDSCDTFDPWKGEGNFKGPCRPGIPMDRRKGNCRLLGKGLLTNGLAVSFVALAGEGAEVDGYLTKLYQMQYIQTQSDYLLSIIMAQRK